MTRRLKEKGPHKKRLKGSFHCPGSFSAQNTHSLVSPDCRSMQQGDSPAAGWAPVASHTVGPERAGRPVPPGATNAALGCDSVGWQVPYARLTARATDGLSSPLLVCRAASVAVLAVARALMAELNCSTEEFRVRAGSREIKFLNLLQPRQPATHPAVSCTSADKWHRVHRPRTNGSQRLGVRRFPGKISANLAFILRRIEPTFCVQL